MNTTNPNGVVVMATKIAGSKCTVYSAWEITRGEHSTITHIGNVCYGRIGTKKLPAEVEAMKPMSDERSKWSRRHHQYEYSRAYTEIRKAYPSLTGREDMGEIDVWAE